MPGCGCSGGGGTMTCEQVQACVGPITCEQVEACITAITCEDVEACMAPAVAALETEIDCAGNTYAGTVYLDCYPGADDDEKLANAMADASSRPLVPVILLGAREYIFTEPLGQPYDRFAIRGAEQTMTFGELGVKDTTRVRLDVPGPWINVSGTMRGLYVGFIDFYSTRTDTEFIRSTGVLWAFTGDTLQFRGFYGVLGSAVNKCLTNFCTTRGEWQINGFHDTPIHLGGSDSEWWVDGALNIGSGTLGPVGGGGGQHYMAKFVGCANSKVGKMYLSCNNEWRGVFTDGTRLGNRGLWFDNLISEGQNGTATSNGSLLQINGGAVGFKQIVIAQGMTDPDLTTPENTWGTPDAGLICVRGADTQVAIDQLCVWHAVGVDQEVPILHVTKHNTPAVPLPASPQVDITHVLMGGKTGTDPWAIIPVVKQTGLGCIFNDHTTDLQTSIVAEAELGIGNVTSAAADSDTEITIPVPTNVADDDLLVAVTFAREDAVPFPSPPAGWTLVNPSADVVGGGLLRLYWHVVTNAGTEPADYTWSGGTLGRELGIMFRVTGADLSNPIDVSGAAAGRQVGPERVTTPTVTTTSDNALLIALVVASTAGGTGVPVFSNVDMVEVEQVGTSTGVTESGLAVFAESLTATGATGFRDNLIDRATANGLGYNVAIRSEN
jgi:hypothetical protein